MLRGTWDTVEGFEQFATAEQTEGLHWRCFEVIVLCLHHYDREGGRDLTCLGKFSLFTELHAGL